MNRKQRAELARETLSVLEKGTYVGGGGALADISAQLTEAVQKTRLYRATDRLAELNGVEAPRDVATAISLRNETTLAAARRIAAEDENASPLCLNFASAKNPGGGFLSGSQAQEESLARASGLYACLMAVPEMYAIGRACRTCLYTHSIVYSPGVPVFRDDDGKFLDSPYNVAMLTVPAVNAGAVKRNEPENVKHISETMRERAEYALAVAYRQHHGTLILGAWGCGVFQNAPADVAGMFLALLQGRFRGLFSRVHFAVLDRTEGESIIGAFKDALGHGES